VVFSAPEPRRRLLQADDAVLAAACAAAVRSGFANWSIALVRSAVETVVSTNRHYIGDVLELDLETSPLGTLWASRVAEQRVERQRLGRLVPDLDVSAIVLTMLTRLRATVRKPLPEGAHEYLLRVMRW